MVQRYTPDTPEPCLGVCENGGDTGLEAGACDGCACGYDGELEQLSLSYVGAVGGNAVDLVERGEVRVEDAAGELGRGREKGRGEKSTDAGKGKEKKTQKEQRTRSRKKKK